MSTILNYRSEIQYNVTSVLSRILSNGGMAPNAFLAAEQKRLQGKYAPVVMNVALMAMGRPQLAPLTACWGLTTQELEWLIEEAKQKNSGTLAEIKNLRDAREAKKQAVQAPTHEPQPQYVEPEEKSLATTYWSAGKFVGNVLIGKIRTISDGFASTDEARAWCIAQDPSVQFVTQSDLLSMDYARNRSEADWNATLWR
jgi:hypothetical protein